MTEKKVKAPNYTPEMTAKAVEMYANGQGASLSEIATALGKSERSVRAKLVRENVYIPADKPAPKAKDEGPTKKELLAVLEKSGFAVDGLEGATKDAIKRVIALVAESKVDQVAEAA